MAIHSYQMQAQSLWWDETLSYHRAVRDIPYILSGRITFFGVNTTDQHPPLYFLLLHFSLSLFGNNEFAMRLPSAFFTVLSVPLSYVMGRRIFDEQVGLATAAIAAVSPYYLYYGQEARSYALVIALGTASAYFLARALQEGKTKLWAIYLMIALASILTHYITIVMILAEAVYVTADSVLKRRVKRLVALGGFALLGIVTAPAVQYMLFRFTILNDSRLQAPFVDVLRDLGMSFSFGTTVNQLDVLPYASGLALVTLAGAVACFSGRNRDPLLFLLARLGLRS